jgi:DNA-binding NarL/FixJ family response regulator
MTSRTVEPGAVNVIETDQVRQRASNGDGSSEQLGPAESTPASTAIRVLLADDHDYVRAWLRAAFAVDGRIEIVGEAVDGVELVQLLPGSADAILLDLVMPRRGGLEVLEDLAHRRDRLPVVVMSAHDDAGHVDRALALGARGYVLKSAPITEIVAALTHAVAGGVYLQPVIAGAVVQRHLLLASASDHTSADLSRRQLELLRALAIGMTNKEIATLLELTQATVNDYMKDLFARLGVASRAAAVSTGMRRGLIE